MKGLTHHFDLGRIDFIQTAGFLLSAFDFASFFDARDQIVKAFGMDIRTISRSAQAMRKSEPDDLFCVLQGRQRPRKLTPEIAALIREMCDTAFALHLPKVVIHQVPPKWFHTQTPLVCSPR